MAYVVPSPIPTPDRPGALERFIRNLQRQAWDDYNRPMLGSRVKAKPRPMLPEDIGIGGE